MCFAQGVAPTDPLIKSILTMFTAALAKENAEFTFGHLVAPPDGPNEGPDKYGQCCDRSKGCDCDGAPYSGPTFDGPPYVGTVPNGYPPQEL